MSGNNNSGNQNIGTGSDQTTEGDRSGEGNWTADDHNGGSTVGQQNGESDKNSYVK